MKKKVIKKTMFIYLVSLFTLLGTTFLMISEPYQAYDLFQKRLVFISHVSSMGLLFVLTMALMVVDIINMDLPEDMKIELDN